MSEKQLQLGLETVNGEDHHNITATEVKQREQDAVKEHLHAKARANITPHVLEEARKVTAQCYCLPATKDLIIVPDLADAFTEQLALCMQTVEDMISYGANIVASRAVLHEQNKALTEVVSALDLKLAQVRHVLADKSIVTSSHRIKLLKKVVEVPVIKEGLQ